MASRVADNDIAMMDMQERAGSELARVGIRICDTLWPKWFWLHWGSSTEVEGDGEC